MIHRTAIIDNDAVIGENTEIGAYTVIGKNVVIGSGTIIGSNVYVECAEIGKNCRLYNSTSIGTSPQVLNHNDNEFSKVYVGDGTVVREFVTLNKGTKEAGTMIGKNCYFMMASHVAHDCVIGDNVVMANCSCAGGHVEVGDDAFISANVGLHQFTKIGRGTMTGSGATVTMDIIPYTLCAGYRAKLVGLNLVGMKRRKMLPEDIHAVKNAYVTLFKSKLLLEDAMEKLEQSCDVKVQEIVKFIKDSKRGIARPE